MNIRADGLGSAARRRRRGGIVLEHAFGVHLGGSAALPCRVEHETVQPRYARFADRIGGSVSEAAMRPSPAHTIEFRWRPSAPWGGKDHIIQRAYNSSYNFPFK